MKCINILYLNEQDIKSFFASAFSLSENEIVVTNSNGEFVVMLEGVTDKEYNFVLQNVGK